MIDGRGLIVMPGFVDTHDHLWQSIIRGCAADGDLLVWLGRCVRPLRTPLFSESDAYAAPRPHRPPSSSSSLLVHPFRWQGLARRPRC